MADQSPSLQGLVAGQQQMLSALSQILVALQNLQQPVIVPTPSTASSAGTPGQISYDLSYIYVCVATNTWRRAAVSVW